ncbi:MAG: class B sortase [Aristaeellaceae bacterium]
MGVLLLCAGRLTGYFAAYISSRQASADLRAIYYEAEDGPEASAEAAYSPEPTAAPAVEATAPPAPTAAATMEPAPIATPRTCLEPVSYPENPYGIVSSRFTRLRRQNSDIIGWLRIDGLLDEAVVQRDNSYYLNRDYRGYHNVNGAIFLDENCGLDTRPYTLPLYGHNMKTGAMFGCLRNYENASFYHANPWVTLDTMYEDGRYVIFAVATVSTDAADRHYLSFGQLLSASIASREAALASLKRLSLYSCHIDVAAEDQLLLLITCTGDDSERRIVAARRVREGEDEAQLSRLVRRNTRK